MHVVDEWFCSYRRANKLSEGAFVLQCSSFLWVRSYRSDCWRSRSVPPPQASRNTADRISILATPGGNSGRSAILRKGAHVSIGLSNDSRIGFAFVGANSDSVPEGEGTHPGKIFYYFGGVENWRTNGRFERVRYRDLYPGTDLIFLTNGQELEYTFERGREPIRE
jgi:hypothetical protein